MAGTELGKAYVQIVPSAQGISGSMTAALNPAATTAGASAGTTVAKNMGSRINAVGKSFIKAGAIATAVSVPIINGIKDAMSAYEVQATAETKLTEIYKTRMGATEGAAKATMELASALQKEGIIGDEVTISGAQQLATFAKYPDTVNALLPAMDNLLAQQKGVNATTDDAVNIGNLMGKVLQGQTGALKRVGISFTAAQEEVLKYGTEEERAAMLAEVINSNVGEMNKALAETPAGQMQQLSNSLGDIKESIGAALAPVLQDLAVWVSEKFVPAFEKLVGFMQDNPVFAKIAVAITGILAVGGPLLMFLGSIMMVAPAIGAAFTALTGPIGIVVAAIAAAIAIGVLLYKNWDTIKAFLIKCWEAIKAAAVTVWNGIKAFFVAIFEAIKLVFTTYVNVWKKIITTVFNGIKTYFKTIFNVYKTIFTTGFNAIKTVVSKIFNGVKNAIVGPIQKARDTLKSIIAKIKSFFNFKISLPHIKLPHFSIQPSGWSIGDLLKGSIPSLGIDWYAKGGIVDRPTVLGAGDVRGGEGIVPLDPFWARMDAMADSIINGFATVAAAGSGDGGNINLDVFLYPSGPKMMEETVKMYDKGKKILG